VDAGEQTDEARIDRLLEGESSLSSDIDNQKIKKLSLEIAQPC